MSKPQGSTDDQEIDLFAISRSIKKGFQNLNRSIFNAILFVIKHIIVIGILLLTGIGMGFYLDSEQKSYNHQLIVQPNFKSVDYLYSKIDLIESKIKEGDTLFLKSIGIHGPQKLSKIKIEPVVDVYEFINPDKYINPGTDKKFDLLKLIAEDGDIKKIIEERTTSKNYTYHQISIKTKGKTNSEMTIKPLLNYLNNNDYFKKCQKEYVNNIHVKMKTNDVIIAQIDAVLNSFSNKANSNSPNDKLVYYNENNQLKDIIDSKSRLIEEQGKFRLDLISFDKIIKENSVVLNILNKESVNGKLKLIIPFLLFFLYLGIYQFFKFYRSQVQISKK